MPIHCHQICLFLSGVMLLLGPTDNLGAGDPSPMPGSYQIVDGKVDWGTFAGWFVFHLVCQTCHGKDAVGTYAAPDLRLSLKTMTQENFSNKVLARYSTSPPSADVNSNDALRQSITDELQRSDRNEQYRLKMPEWPKGGGIEPHVPNLYAYLKARSDDAVGTGRPATMDP